MLELPSINHEILSVILVPTTPPHPTITPTPHRYRPQSHPSPPFLLFHMPHSTFRTRNIYNTNPIVYNVQCTLYSLHVNHSSITHPRHRPHHPQNKEGKFMWPGFGENCRVLDWICRRTDGQAEAVKTPIGYLPQENGWLCER